jgi:hypothetical protein
MMIDTRFSLEKTPSNRFMGLRHSARFSFELQKLHPLQPTLHPTDSIPTISIGMSSPLVQYHAFSCKISFSENLRNLVLTQHWGSHSDKDIQEHVTATLTKPPRILTDYLVKEVEEEMDFADALISFTQPPLTKIDMLLEKELSGQPVSFCERDYTPAIAASPFYISHSYPSLWILHRLGVSKDDNFFENIRLEKGSPLRLFNLYLARRTFSFDTPSLFCTIDYFLHDEPGFMMAKADTHLYTRTSKHDVLIPPSFFIAIPKKICSPRRSHLYQQGRDIWAPLLERLWQTSASAPPEGLGKKP